MVELKVSELKFLLTLIEHEENYTGLTESERELETKLYEKYREFGGHVNG